MNRRADEQLRAELTALEQSAPSATPPTPDSLRTSLVGRAAAAGGVLAAGVIIGLLAAQIVPETDPQVAATPSPEVDPDESQATPESTLAPPATPNPSHDDAVIDEWTLVVLDTEPDRSEVWAVIDTPAGLLAVGRHDRSGAIWTSDDGLEWRSLDDLPQAPADGSIVLVDVVRGTSGYVAVGWLRDAEGLVLSSVLWASGDGARWEELSTPADSVQLQGLATVEDEYFAVGAQLHGPRGGGPAPGVGAVVWRSTDGRDWWSAAVHDDAAVGAMFDIAKIGDRLVGVGVRGPHPLDPPPGAWYSDDGGQSWMPADPPPGADGAPGAMMRSLIAVDEHLVAVGGGLHHGSSIQLSWMTTNGATWDLAFEASQELCCGLLSHPVATPGGILAAGSTAEAPVIWRSEEGVGWEIATTVPLSHGSVTHLATMGDKLVAVGNRRTSSLAGAQPTVAIMELDALD